MNRVAACAIALLCAVVIRTASADTLPGELNFESLTKDATTVEEVVAVVRRKLESRGYDIPLLVDHAAAAASVGLKLRPTQVLFARPPEYLERALLRRSATIGIDLPVKFLVFEDEGGGIQLRINPIGYLIDRHDVPLDDWATRAYRRTTERFGDPADGLVTVRSRRNVKETVDALVAAISANPAFRIPLVLDYGEKRPGPVLVVFGNPNAGTPLMQTTQEVALDLPQKMLIWRSHGKVFVTYNDPFFVAARSNVTGQDTLLGVIARALANFAAAAAGTLTRAQLRLLGSRGAKDAPRN